MSSHEQSFRAGETKGRAQEKANEAMGNIGEKAQQVKEKTAGTAQAVKEKAQNEAQSTRKKAQEKGGTANERASGMGQSTRVPAQLGKDNSEGFLQQAGDKVKGMADTVKNTFGMAHHDKDEDYTQPRSY